jgi:hypothetical protein
LKSAASKSGLLHRADSLRDSAVNKAFNELVTTLISLPALSCPPVIHYALLGTTLFTMFRCRFTKMIYACTSSLKELGLTAVIASELLSGSRIIPGDWGKAGSGWLARPLSSRIARFGSGGRIHQFL